MARYSHGNQPPRVRLTPPGRRSRRLARRLATVESRNVTALTEDFPIFWERARGSNVWDADGNRYVDLTAGFGVAAVGHAHPRVVAAIRRQAGRLPHGMGDVHPAPAKVRLLQRLSELLPLPEARAVLACSGAEAVEVALKTAALATGRPGVLAFTGAYHGLTYGALAVTDRAHFRAPFEEALNPHIVRSPYPHPYRPPPELRGAADLGAAALEAAERRLEGPPGRVVGAVIVEPVQGRGGEVVPPRGFLAGVAELCRRRGHLLIVDEIFSGLGRTGRWLACERDGVVPDLVTVGKALSASLPIAACVGSRATMEAWPRSRGEAIHTSTFLGNPVACAAALASLEVLQRGGLAERSAREGERWRARLARLVERHPGVGEVRGEGLLAGVDLVRDRGSREPDPELARRVVVAALRRGWIVLGGGPEGNVLSLSPPLTISRALLDDSVDALDAALAEAAGED